MPLTTAERKRLSRERKKQQMKKAPDASEAILKTPFSEFARSRPIVFDSDLDFFGVRIMGKDFLESEVQEFPSEHQHNRPMTALERATGLVGVFTDAAAELARLVNDYKLAEVEARLSELAAADLSDPATKASALKNAIQLDRLRKRLEKRTSFFLPIIEVKEES